MAISSIVSGSVFSRDSSRWGSPVRGWMMTGSFVKRTCCQAGHLSALVSRGKAARSAAEAQWPARFTARAMSSGHGSSPRSSRRVWLVPRSCPSRVRMRMSAFSMGSWRKAASWTRARSSVLSVMEDPSAGGLC